jgi:FkbM family methyltransferase
MKNLKNKPLFEVKNSNSNILNKIRRYIVDREMARISSINIKKHKQLAVFSFDYISNLINIDGIYEIDDLNIFINWLKSFNSKEIFNGIVLDIGANIGNHSLFFSDYFTEVYSYEPHPLNYKILHFNSCLAINVKCFHTGISSSNGICELEYNKNNMGGGRIENKARDNSYDLSYTVNLNTIDFLLSKDEQISPVKLIKIDVEGHELEALKGAEHTIKRFQPIIIFEQHSTEFFDGTTNVIDLLKLYGYKKFAKIDKSPSPPEYLPTFLKLFYSTILRIFFGSSIKISVVEHFQPKFYPFIIAIPNRLNI